MEPSEHGKPVVPSADGGAISDRITRSNLSKQIAERLRHDIVHGQIPAGTHVVQDELCERFGTSRMPVRDALQQLTHEGLLELHGQQRIVVPLGAEDLEDVHTLTAVLHGWAAGRATKLASDADLGQLAAKCEADSAVRDPYEFSRLAMELHRRINVLARSPRLIRTLRMFQQSVPRAFPFYAPEEMASSKLRHQAIVAAMLDRDAELAERLTRSNSIVYVDLLLRSLGGRPRP